VNQSRVKSISSGKYPDRGEVELGPLSLYHRASSVEVGRLRRRALFTNCGYGKPWGFRAGAADANQIVGAAGESLKAE
jgi:hypothetical protein